MSQFQDSYIIHYHQDLTENPHFSGLFDSILKAVTTGFGIFSSLGGGGGGSSSGGGCTGQARGTTAITQCSQQVLNALDGLLQQVGHQPYEQIIQQAQTLVAALSNSQYFYQAQHGDDAAALASAKTAAQQKLQAIISAANQAANNPTGTAVGQTGQIISSGGNVATTGLDTVSSLLNDKFLVYGLIGIVAYSLFLKPNK